MEKTLREKREHLLDKIHYDHPELTKEFKKLQIEIITQDKQFLEDLKKEIQMGHTCEMFCPHNEIIKQVDKLGGYAKEVRDVPKK